MKSTDCTNGIKILAPAILFFVLVYLFTGCVSMQPAASVDVGSKHSETEYGGGITALAGTQLPNKITSIYGLAGYHYYSFEGGHDNLFQLGIQGRQMLGEKGFWAGGEAGWLKDTSVYTDGDRSNPSSNGFFMGALAGYRLPVSVVDMSVFTGLDFLSFGDFKADNSVYEAGHNSIQLKLGVSVALPFSE